VQSIVLDNHYKFLNRKTTIMKILKLSWVALIAMTFVVFFACKKNVADPSVTSAAKPNNALEAPTISCVSSTKHTITLRITAGASGAPAGFSVQWKVAGGPFVAECQASFSGVPGCSQYNLAAGESIEVVIGALSDVECGVSGGCGELACGTTYTFRAFAHNVPGGKNKSDFSPTQNCSTAACGTQGCDTETAWGGNAGTNVGTAGAWFYLYDKVGVQTLWAGQYSNAGTVQYSADNGGTLTIILASGWELNPGTNEPVKIQCYSVAPTTRPAAGLFTTYKGTALTIPNIGDCAYYAIHLDVQHCQ
jgi:hypothetical protein